MLTRVPAVYARGGTSRALLFRAADLPVRSHAHGREWDHIFLRAMGSPDPAYGRQLDGLGGGLSSLSKACVVARSTHPDADVDYTFAQVSVREAKVDYGSNCGNISAAVGPFAVDEGLFVPAMHSALKAKLKKCAQLTQSPVASVSDVDVATSASVPDVPVSVSASGNITPVPVCVRMRNTNTDKIIWARFHVDANTGKTINSLDTVMKENAVDGDSDGDGDGDGDGSVNAHKSSNDNCVDAVGGGDEAVCDADVSIPGVFGRSAPVTLEFRSPGGASTGRGLLPTGNTVDVLDLSEAAAVIANTDAAAPTTSCDRPVQCLEDCLAGLTSIEASLVDAGNACVFVRARDLGLVTDRTTSTIDTAGTNTDTTHTNDASRSISTRVGELPMPADIESDALLCRRLQAIRLAASVRMGIAHSLQEAMQSTAVPFVGFVSAPPLSKDTNNGVVSEEKEEEAEEEEEADICARMMSSGQAHRALPLTSTLCLAVAARIDGTIVHEAVAEGTRRHRERRSGKNNSDVSSGSGSGSGVLRIAMPSGVLRAAASVEKKKKNEHGDGDSSDDGTAQQGQQHAHEHEHQQQQGHGQQQQQRHQYQQQHQQHPQQQGQQQWVAHYGSFVRTQRRLFEGSVLI